MMSIVNKSRFNFSFFRIAIAFLGGWILGIGSSLQAQSSSQLYSSANSLYKSNQFEEAAVNYEKILAQGFQTAEVYYNLGNCYYKLKNTGKAILYYERALKLAPNDEDVWHNLKHAQFRATDKLIPVPQLALVTAWNNFTTSQSSKAWGVWALVFIWFALVAFAVYLFVGVKRLMITLSFLMFFLSIAAVSLAFKQSQAEEHSEFAILLVNNLNVKSAPDMNGTDLFTIHEGIKFQILDQVGNWNKIRLADGKIGWIEKGMFEKI
ncbi:MAG: tetratricopeptide repeat protein [Chitinophagales bacterium]